MAQKNKDLSLDVVLDAEHRRHRRIGRCRAPSPAHATVSLTAVGTGSIAFGVGKDYDNAIARTLGSNQTLLSQWLDPHR